MNLNIFPATDLVSIDRISPTVRPNERCVMRQRWSHLLFLHWEVDPEEIQKLLPDGLELDTFEGRPYVGLVPFTMSDVRPVWAPAFRPLSDFHETNVRTYVIYKGAPGVWFFSLDAANSIAVRIARAVWKLPYHRAEMELTVRNTPGVSKGLPHLEVDYSTRRLWPQPIPANCKVKYRVQSPIVHGVPGTLEHFLAERYYLYTSRNGSLYRGQVHHVPYPLQVAEVDGYEESMVDAAGIKTRLRSEPLAHYAADLDVWIYGLHKL